MLFNSWSFLILLVATFTLYHIPVPGMRRKTWQVGLLLAASAVFYAWNEPRLLILLGASCLLNAIAVERILFHKTGRADPAQNCRRLVGSLDRSDSDVPRRGERSEGRVNQSADTTTLPPDLSFI